MPTLVTVAQTYLCAEYSAKSKETATTVWKRDSSFIAYVIIGAKSRSVLATVANT